MFFALSAAAEITFDRGGRCGLKEELPGVAVPAAAPAKNISGPAKEWTIMVYVNAKNNLETYGLKDVNEMEMTGSSDKVNIVVEMGRMKGYNDSDGDWTGVRRYLVRRDTDAAAITSPVLSEFSADMGDYRHLIEFGRWAKAEYPAKKYMLVVWNPELLT